MIGDGNKTYDVLVQDTISPPVQYYLMREDKIDITLTAAIIPDASVIKVSAGHGFVIGHWMAIFENNRYMQARVTNVATNDITISTPSANAFSIAAIVIRGVIDLNVNGSVTPQTFSFRPLPPSNPAIPAVPLDIVTVAVSMIVSTAPDNSKFGHLTALTNGLLLRKENLIIQNLGNYNANIRFLEYGAELSYTDKGGGGAYSVTALFDIRKVYGIALRLSSNHEDVMKAIVRDDLTTITSFRISVMGQFTEGEF